MTRTQRSKKWLRRAAISLLIIAGVVTLPFIGRFVWTEGALGGFDSTTGLRRHYEPLIVQDEDFWTSVVLSAITITWYGFVGASLAVAAATVVAVYAVVRKSFSRKAV